MDVIRLNTGLEVGIRSIRTDDGDRLQEAHQRLSLETRYRRFLAAKPVLSPGDVRYLTGVDGHDHVALVAIPVDEPERIIGVARFVRSSDDPAAAELAIVVGDAFQGQGLGTALLAQLADAARARGIERLKATTLADNQAVHRLVQRLGATQPTDAEAGPVHELVVDLAA